MRPFSCHIGKEKSERHEHKQIACQILHTVQFIGVVYIHFYCFQRREICRAQSLKYDASAPGTRNFHKLLIGIFEDNNLNDNQNVDSKKEFPPVSFLHTRSP